MTVTIRPRSLLTPSRPFFGAILAICALSLGAALAGQYLFGLEPCVLCLYERVPYVLAGLVAGAMAVLPTSPGLRRLGAVLCLLAFVANAGLGFYHVGVEQAWWTSAVCTAEIGQGMSAGDLMAALQEPGRPSCDQVQWTLFGVSLAGYNLLLSLALAAFCGVALLNRTTPRSAR